MGIPRVFITRWRDGVFIDCLSLLSRRDKIKVLFVFIIQVFLGALDLIGIALVGVLGALSINGIKSTTPGNRTAQILDFFQLGNSTFQEQVAWQVPLLGHFSY